MPNISIIAGNKVLCKKNEKKLQKRTKRAKKYFE